MDFYKLRDMIKMQTLLVCLKVVFNEVESHFKGLISC